MLPELCRYLIGSGTEAELAWGGLGLRPLVPGHGAAGQHHGLLVALAREHDHVAGASRPEHVADRLAPVEHDLVVATAPAGGGALLDLARQVGRVLGPRVVGRDDEEGPVGGPPPAPPPPP